MARRRVSAPAKLETKAKIEIDDATLKEAFDRLSRLEPKALTRANKAMFSDCSRVLMNETKKLIRGSMKNATRVPSQWRQYPGVEAPTKAPHKLVARNGNWAYVSIYNNRTFWVHMHNKGTERRETKGNRTRSQIIVKTKRRYLRKGINRGAIAPQNYIEEAIKVCNSEVKRIQEQAFVRNVTRQWQRAGN